MTSIGPSIYPSVGAWFTLWTHACMLLTSCVPLPLQSVEVAPRIQQARAETQHQALIDLIREHEWESGQGAWIDLVPIMLGVSGTIYNDFLEAADNNLGIKGTAKATLAKRLHLIAVTHVRKIWRLRQRMMREGEACARHNWSKAKRRLRLHQTPHHRKMKRRRKA